MSRVGIAHHHSAITVGGAHPTATFLWAFVSQRLMAVHPKMPSLTHPHPIPPLEGEGTFFQVGLFLPLLECLGYFPAGISLLYVLSLVIKLLPFGNTYLNLCNPPLKINLQWD